MEPKTFKNWWLLAINGIIAVLIGILLLFFSKEFMEVLVKIVGYVVLVAGIILLVAGLYYMKKDKSVALMITEAVIGITIGLIILLFPQNTLKWFIILIGVWSIVMGIIQLVVLVNIRKTGMSGNVILFNGLLTIGLGVFLMLYPIEFATIVAKLLGIASGLFGIVMIYLGFSIRKIHPIREKDPPVS